MSNTIELAPNHKIGLSLTNPVMIAAGCGGYGPAYRPLIDLSAFGALVTNPITLRPQRGAPQPRLVEATAGVILNTGEQNPGVKKVIQLYAKIWRSLGAPVIAHLPAAAPDDLSRTAQALASTEAIAAIEIGLPDDALPREVAAWLRAVREGGMLPVLVKLPLSTAVNLAEAAEDAQADALVIGSPPTGAALAANGQLVSGHVYGPAWHNLALHQLQLARAEVDLPIIASGGIHSLADAQAFLSAGAVAVQIDTLLWIEPKQAEAMTRQLTVDSRQ